MIVADASLVVDSLVSPGPVGQWARAQLDHQLEVHSPWLLGVEVSAAFRRQVANGVLDERFARVGLDDLRRMHVQHHPYEPFLPRIWELRDTVTAYDAWYVALAEHLAVPVVTCDRRLGGSPDLRCEVVVPPDGLT